MCQEACQTVCTPGVNVFFHHGVHSWHTFHTIVSTPRIQCTVWFADTRALDKKSSWFDKMFRKQKTCGNQTWSEHKHFEVALPLYQWNKHVSMRGSVFIWWKLRIWCLELCHLILHVVLWSQSLWHYWLLWNRKYSVPNVWNQWSQLIVCSVLCRRRAGVRSVCVRSHSVPVGLRFSGYIIPRYSKLAVWFYQVSFEKQCIGCACSMHQKISFMVRDLTFCRKTWWWKQDQASAFNFSSNSGDCTSYFTQATSVFSSSSFSLEPPVSTHFWGTGLGSFQVNCTSLVEF